jgi:competence protein ComEC
MRVDPVLVVSAALLLGGTLVTAPIPVALAVLAIAWILRAQLGVRAWIAALIALGISAVAARSALDTFEVRRVAARDALGAPVRCAGQVTIAESPTWSDGTASSIVETEQLDCEGRIVTGHTGRLRLRLYGGPDGLGRGDRIDVVAQIAPVRLFRNLDAADPTPGAARRGTVLSGTALSAALVERGHGLGHLIDRARAHCRQRILATFSPKAAPMARALVLGENDLDPSDDDAFKRSGLAHLLAVSGTHLVFAVLSLVRAFALVLVRIEAIAARFDAARIAAGGGAVLALLYADFAGGSGSAWRAAWMLSAGLSVRALGRRPSTIRCVAVSVSIGALVDPLVMFDLSFLLSIAATLGLIVIGQPLGRYCDSVTLRPLRWLLLSMAATVASMLPCAPLLALLSPDLGLAGLLANVVAAPLGEIVALPLCLTHPLTAPLPALEKGVALVASGGLLVVRAVAHASASATWFALPVPQPGAWHLAVLGVGAVGARLAYGTRRALLCSFWALTLAAGLSAVELAMRRAGTPQGRLRITAIDVEQGDSTLVDLPDGGLMLVDAGGFVGSPVDPGRAVIQPLLRARRRDRIDIAVLSHPHPDHFGGLAAALAGVEVGEFWDSGQGEAEGAGPAYAALLRELRAREIPILRPAELCGRPRVHGAATVEVLGPCPTFVPNRDANDNSLVVRISIGDRAVLLTGDAEHLQEAELLQAHGPRLKADLLKVGHHGSRTSSTPAFVAAVNPALSTISCGVRNRFGHPHAETLATFGRHGVRALRLDRTGSVLWQTDGKAVDVWSFSAAY